MDSRWRFLHCCWPELRGRMWEAWARRGEPRTSGGGAWEENPPGESRARDVDRSVVGKHAEHVPRKAAMAPVAPVP